MAFPTHALALNEEGGQADEVKRLHLGRRRSLQIAGSIGRWGGGNLVLTPHDHEHQQIKHVVDSRITSLPYQHLRVSRLITYSSSFQPECAELTSSARIAAPAAIPTNSPTMSAFETAANDSKKLTKKPTNDELLELYGASSRSPPTSYRAKNI